MQRAVAVSDGSFKDSKGTAAFVMEGKDSVGGLFGTLIAPGDPGIQSAYRSKLTGLLGIVVCVFSLCKAFNIQQGKVTVSCDGLAALNNAFAYEDELPPTVQHFDLLMAIRHWKKRCPITWCTKHVKGHQDDNPWNVLDRWATLNQAMDLKAKQRLSRLTQPSNVRGPPHFQSEVEGEPWPLHLAGKKVSTNFSQQLHHHMSSQDALDHWSSKKSRFGKGSHTDVD